MYRRLPAETLTRILIARWQRMARRTLSARQRRPDIANEAHMRRSVRRFS